MRLFKYLASLWDKYRGDGGRLVRPVPRPAEPLTFEYAPPSTEPVRGQAANAVIVDEKQEPGPGHPEWKGRAEIPLVVGGWALPGHPMYFYQQFLKYQHDANGLPAGWKVIGWTPEGVSYLVPEAHWTEKERACPHVTIRNEHSPHRTPDEVYREKLKAQTPALMADAEIDARISQYRAYTTKLNEKAAEVLDAVRAGAERHARVLLDNNSELSETIEGWGTEKEKQRRVDEWVKECGQRAVDKRLADAVRLLGENSLLKAIPVDNFIYEPPKG